MAQPEKNIVGILLAAGAGSRFGGDKLIHPLSDGVAIAAHAARNLIAAGLAVTAVVRSGDFPLADMLEQEGCMVSAFANAARGMGASLAHAIETERAAGGWVVALADMPGIAPATIRAVVTALEAGALIAAPRFQDQRGHPVGFSAALLGELLALDGDEGARAVLDKHRESVRLLECNDPAVLYDIDRKSDVRR
ncbi:MAG TPA: nucleotidyltransferase family protein [Longimicrobiales bacterium]